MGQRRNSKHAIVEIVHIKSCLDHPFVCGLRLDFERHVFKAFTTCKQELISISRVYITEMYLLFCGFWFLVEIEMNA